MTRLHIPAAWRESAQTILQEQPRVILVLGGGDAGKTSYCRYLVSELFAAGHRVALVDADIGQKEIGPPATVTLSYSEGAGELRAMAPQLFYFVGSTSPSGRLLPLIVGTARLVHAAEAPFVIVDTTGYVEGVGRVLKGYKIEAVRPDFIIAIQRRRELEAILRAHGARRTVRIRPSRKARPRDSWERYLARKNAFAAYFDTASRFALSLDKLIFQRSLLFTGDPITLADTLYAERTAEGVVAVSENPPADGDVVKWLKPGFERSLLCGVADERGNGLGLAIVESIDFARRTVTVLSPVPVEWLRVLQWGDLYISRDGRELGSVGPEGL